MIIKCPACKEDIKVYIKIRVIEDVFDKNGAPIILTNASYNPMRAHWKKAGHDKKSWVGIAS